MKKKSPSSPEVTLLDQTISPPEYEHVYGRGNPWVQWLSLHAKHVLQFRPVMRAKTHGVRGARAPKCPACSKTMAFTGSGAYVCHRIDPLDRHGACNVRIKEIVTEGPIRVCDEDGKRIRPEDLQNRPIDIVYERGKYRARAVIR